MPQQYASDLIDMLKQTLKKLEEVHMLGPDDLTFVELRHQIMQAIAQLKVARKGDPLQASLWRSLVTRRPPFG